MFRAVKSWLALLIAILAPLPGVCADDLNTAAAALARKTAALAGRGESVAVSYRNLSSLAPTESGAVRTAFESALRDSGCRISEGSATEAKLTVSETPAQFLIVEEARRGDERQVWIASWNRATGAPVKTAGASLQLTQAWRQSEQILDVAFFASGMLVLSPARLTLFTRTNNTWTPRESAAINSAKPWPRDLRGRVRVTGSNFQIFLPGLACNGSADGSLAVDCHASDAPWVLESGNHGLLLAAFASARNYFDGRVVTQTGARKTVPPFYSAASVESQGRTLWVMAQLDGRAQITDAALEPMAAIAQWGSDIAGIDPRCGGGSQVLATRASDSAEPDALQSFVIADRVATPATAPVLLPGPVTALWPSGPAAAVAVARDLVSGDYIAYVASVSCQ
jgi:hypothetical protein